MTNFISFLRKSILGLSRYQLSLLVVWVILLITLPSLRMVVGFQMMRAAFELLVLVQVLIVLNALYSAWGWWNMLRTTGAVILLTLAALAIGIRIGYPFGRFHYTGILQPQILGVPLLLPLAWLMMLPPSWALAKLVTRKAGGCLVRPLFILVSALAFTAWDFYFEPLMIRWEYLKWDEPGGFFGVPWMNFAGWIVVSALITFAIAPKQLPAGLLVLVYALTWFLGFITMSFIWKMTGPALAGFGVMGCLLVIGAIKTG